MAYIQNEKGTGLDTLPTLASNDLIIVSDVSDSGRAKAITEANLEVALGIDVIEADILAIQGDITTLNGDVVNLQNQINNINTGGGGFGSFDGKIKSYSLEGLEGIPMLQGYQDVECYLTANGTVVNAEFIQDFLQTRDVTLDWADADQINGYVVLSGFLYLLLRDNGTPEYRVYRYNVTDLSLGGTVITFVTQALGTTDEMVMTSDGTDFFFNYDAGNSVNDYDISKYSVSSTTFTWVSDVACGAIANATKLFAVFASGDIYGYNTVGTRQFKKFDNAGALQDTFGPYDSAYNNLINWTETLYIVKSTGDDEAYRVQLETDSPGTSAGIVFEDDFVGGDDVVSAEASAPGSIEIGQNIGSLNWQGTASTTSSQIGNRIDSVANHPGLFQIGTGSGSYEKNITLGTNSALSIVRGYPIPDIMSDGNIYTFIVRPATVAATRVVYVQIGDTVLSDNMVDNSIRLEFNQASGNIIFRTRDGATTQSTTIAAYNTALYYNIRFEINGVAVECYINNILVATHSTNVPAAGVGTANIYSENDSVIIVDYVKLELVGITR